jgi:hypothetical protein
MRLIAKVQELPESATVEADDTASSTDLLPYCAQCQAYIMHPSFTEDAGLEQAAGLVSGWLEKKRGMLSGWKRRFGVVAVGHCVYFEKENDRSVAAPVGVIHMGDVLLEDPDPEGGCTLELVEPEKGRLMIKVASPSSKHKWMRALLLASRFVSPTGINTGPVDNRPSSQRRSSAHSSKSVTPLKVKLSSVNADTLRLRGKRSPSPSPVSP